MTAPDALFDLAINRAAAFLRGARPTRLDEALAGWHARTRFARRVPLQDVHRCLASRPDGDWHWEGGPAGGWKPGKARFP